MLDVKQPKILMFDVIEGKILVFSVFEIPPSRPSCPVLHAIFLGFLRQFLPTEFQPTVDLKMYLKRWTTQTYYFNYSDSSRIL